MSMLFSCWWNENPKEKLILVKETAVLIAGSVETATARVRKEFKIPKGIKVHAGRVDGIYKYTETL